ncbi:MAG: helix-turn-helix domain-containing protein [Nakamurella sp.]
MINSSERTATQSIDVNATGSSLGPRHSRPSLPHLSGARAGVLRAVAATDDPVTVASLAEQLNQHPNTVREHLDALVANGRVERFRRAPSGRGRPAWLYRFATVTAGDADGSDLMSGPVGADGQEYVALAVALIDQVSATSPDPRAMARAAGERWGRTLVERHVGNLTAPSSKPTAQVAELLRELRFESQSTDDPKKMRLTTCPFLDAAKRHPEVVCQIHLGIVRGAMEQLGADPESADLHPFAEPGACLLNFPDPT